MNSCLLSTGSEAGVTASATAHHRYSTPDLLYVRQDTHAALLAEQPEAVYFLATLIPVNWRIVDCPRQDALYRQWHPTVRASAANLCCEKTKLVVFLCSRRQSTPCRSSSPPPQRALARCRQRAPHRQQQPSTCAPPTNRPRRGHVNLPVADQPAAAPGGHFWQAQKWCMTNHCMA